MSVCINDYGYFRYETAVTVCCKTCLEIISCFEGYSKELRNRISDYSENINSGHWRKGSTGGRM